MNSYFLTFAFAHHGVTAIESTTEFLFEGAPQQECIQINILDDEIVEQSESFLVIINTTLTSQTVSLNPQYAFVTIIDDDRKYSGNSWAHLMSKHCLLYATSCLICLCRSYGATWCHCWECGGCHSSPTVCWRHHICIPLLQKKEAHYQKPKDTVLTCLNT